MSEFEAFEDKWLPVLASRAMVCFRSGTPDPDAFTHAAIADQFVQSHQMSPIGFNWELLDADADRDKPRSALGELTKALSHDLANPSKDWLEQKTASQCAQEFLSLFEPAGRTIIANRYDGLWNPISGQAVEWGFVGFDQRKIALLLLAQS